ncbi:MAG: hypothetical protein IRZ05_18070, partial [Micromonosporaceae bacterium]|nr:hypothetical protein [Micromonosporaceae bacterium]
MTSGRLRVEVSAQASALVDRLVALALRGLPLMYRSDREEFAFTRAADTGGSNGDGAASIRASSAELRGSSTRYAAIVALGSQFLDADDQRRILGGRTTGEFVELLVKRLPQTRNLGDVALVCWAAAEANQSVLPPALTRLREIDDGDRPQYVVEAAWVLAALTAMRKLVDVEAALERARRRLLASQVPGSPLFPHATGAGLLPWYRSHISCYADQVYPIQALA